MAAQYDELGNYLGDWETEEERKKREEELANTAVRTQEIKTYGDGTVERVTKEETPGGGVMAPAVQQVAIQPVQRTAVRQPVAPISPDTFARMQQAESGNRDFDAQGRPITSSAGAMFRNQVMPSTAANPGYGVRPAQSQTPEEYNRVGQEYFQALLKQFNGDEQKAVAAYNAGPGRVQQNIAANQGQLNPAQLPRETQGYMDKVLGGVGRVVNAVMPSAQAGTLPAGQAQQAPTITAPQTRTAINPETGETYQQLMPVAPGAAPAPAQAAGAPAAQPAPNSYDEFGTPVYSERQATLDKYTSALTQGQGNLGALDAIRSDTNAPEWIRTTAGEQAYDLMSQEVKNKQAQQQAKELATGAAMGDRKAANTIAKELQNQDGSYLKMILLGFISPQLAGEEAIKLGYGNKWIQGADAEGNPAMIQINAKGLPLKGYKGDGTALAESELVAYTGGGAKKLNIVGGSYVNDKTGEVGRLITDEKTGTSYIQTDKGRKPMAGFRPQGQGGTLEDQRTKLVQEMNIRLQGKTQEEKMAIAREYNSKLVGQGYQPLQTYEINLQAPQIAGGPAPAQAAPAPAPAQAAPAGQVAGPVPPVSAAPAQAAPVTGQVARPAVPGATVPQVTGARPTMSQMEASAAGEKKTATETAEDLAKLKANQPKAEKSADYLVTKIDELVNHPGFETSVGAQGASYLFGMLDKPLPPQLGGGDARNWAARFKEVQGQQFLQAIETMRGTGAISEKEGTEAKAAISRMSTSQTEAEFRQAATDFQNIVRRGVDTTREKLGQAPKYNVAPESEISARPEAMTPAQKAQAELEKRRKEKK